MPDIDKDGLSFFTEGAYEESVSRKSVFSEVPKNRLDRMLTYRGDEEIGVAQLSDLDEVAPIASATHPSLIDGASTWQQAFILHGPSGLESLQRSVSSTTVGQSRRRGLRSLLSWHIRTPSNFKTQDSKDVS